MVKTFDDNGPINGSRVRGGIIENFSSTGISDRSTETTLIIEDGHIRVSSLSVENIRGNLSVDGDLKIKGTLEVDIIRANQIVNTQRHQKQYLEFVPTNGSVTGSGLMWSDGKRNKVLIFNTDPDRIWSSEHIDIANEKAYMIGSNPVLTADSLGSGVTNSKLTSVGRLHSLEVSGNLNIGNHIFYDKKSQRTGIGTDLPNGLLSLFDYESNVEFIFDGDKSTGFGKIGTFNTKGLSLVTDNTVRLHISETGNVTIGHEHRDTQVRVFGKLSVGVKNPTEAFEVGGNIKVNNQLFARDRHPPTDGVYQTGDIIWNTFPKPSGYIGWVCTNGGAPGSWRPFGLIE